MRGVKKIPIEVKEAKGTLRADRQIVSIKPAIVRGMPPPPALVNLDEHALQVWQETVLRLANLKALTENDLLALAAYCQATSTYWKAQAMLQEKGVILEIKTMAGVTVRKNPAIDIASASYVIMKDGFTRFGLTPVDRQNVPVLSDQEETGGDEWGL